MRGKDTEHYQEDVWSGITPARAGKSDLPLRVLHGAQDHPRACGEKGNAGKESEWQKGSPPRVRGKVYLHARILLKPGITPARAGKSNW